MIDTHDNDMTLRAAINAHRAARDDLKRIYKKIAGYRQRAYSISSPQNDGMPKTKGNYESKAERAAIRLAEMEETATEIQAEILHYESMIYSHISKIKDSQMRLLLQLHFADGLTYESITRILKDGNDADSYKKAVCRFMKSYETEEHNEE